MNDRHQLFLGLFVLLGAVAFGIWQWSVLDSLKVEASALQTEASNLTSLSETLANEYQEIKVEVTADRETNAQELSEVFPYDEDLTTLTRLFDTYAVKNNFSSNPFFINSINYGEATTPDGANYRIIPFDVSIEASKKNLSKFFEMIEASGSLEAGDRLMSLENVTIDYPSEYGGTYNARAEIYAYFAPEL